MATLDHIQQRASALLSQGAPLPAYDFIAEGLREFPGDPLLRRLMALALARSGATAQAQQILATLVSEGHHDEETAGMLARTFKDLWVSARDRHRARGYLEQAHHWYADAHRVSGGYWSGINAATTALLLGDTARAASLAERVKAVCLDRRATAADAYWLTATLGEAALLLGDRDDAVRWYRDAVATCPHGIGDMVATRRNARLILKHQRAGADAIDACFRVPRVAVFAGHLIDQFDREVSRFPGELEDAVRAALLDTLRGLDIGVGFASAANGGDLLFLECLQAIGAESHVVLPYDRDQFLADSVSFAPGWADRFAAALARAKQIVTASEQRMRGNAVSFEYGFRLLDGTARLRAEELDTDLVCIAVWDGKAGDGPGGTAAAIDHWRRGNRRIEIIDLHAIGGSASPRRPTVAAAVPAEPATDRSARQTTEARIVGLVFADVAGFSKVSEDQIPRFIEHYMGEIGRVIAAFPDKAILTNTWGDGLYFVFAGVREAGAFALHLSEVLRGIDWTARGLPAALGIRIAVHAGPAYACTDPVTGRPNYLGSHVSFAARIEPITPPGVVYGSGAFAALARSAGVESFTCAYVGPTPLAKGAGTTPMYAIQPRPDRT